MVFKKYSVNIGTMDSRYTMCTVNTAYLFARQLCYFETKYYQCFYLLSPFTEDLQISILEVWCYIDLAHLALEDCMHDYVTDARNVAQLVFYQKKLQISPSMDFHGHYNNHRVCRQAEEIVVIRCS